jgi:hypothetical protein
MGAKSMWIVYEFALDNGEVYQVATESERVEGSGTGKLGKAASDYIAGLINDAYGYLMLQRLDNGAPANTYALIAARHITRVTWELVAGTPPEPMWQFR